MAHLQLKGLRTILDLPAGEELSNAQKLKDADIYAELLQCLDDKSIALVMRDSSDSGRAAVKILREHYLRQSKPRLVQMYTELCTLSMSDSETITDFLIRAERASTALKAAGEVVSDGLLIAMVVKALPTHFETFATLASQNMNDDISFMKFKVSLRSFEEAHSQRNQPENDNKVMKTIVRDRGRDRVSNNDGPLKLTCYRCKEPGHKAADCYAKLPDNTSERWCNYCKSTTHDTKFCRKLKDKAKSAQDTVVDIDESYNHNVFKVDVHDTPDMHDSDFACTFLVDCGATSHIVKDRSLFVHLDGNFESEKHVIELADGSQCTNVVKGKGEAQVVFHDVEGNPQEVSLTNALYVPSYNQNIFSVQAATNKGAKLTFDKDSANMTSAKNVKFDIQRYGRLYYLNSISSMTESRRSLEQWHKSLGHCNVPDVIATEKVVNGMNITDKKAFDCSSCTMGKMSESRSRKPDSKSSEPFEFVHCDLAGPMETISIDGHKYAMLFVDDHTGANTVYFLKAKSDAIDAARKFLADTAPYGKIKKIRTDNGTEFTNAEFKKLMIENCIKHETSAPYSAHQNGTVERGWRTLFDMARTLLIDSNTPKFLWPYAVLMSMHIRNRCINHRIGKTPYEAMTGNKPNLSKLHLFGSNCFAYIQQKKKLDPRAEPCIFLGYDKYSPAHFVFFPEENKIKRVRCVKFTDSFGTKSDEKAAEPADPCEIRDDCTVELTDPYEIKDDSTDETESKSDDSGKRDLPARERKRPKKYDDYLTDLNCNIDYCCRAVLCIPQTYNDAITCDEATMWTEAMETEMKALNDNETYELTKLPKGEHLVGGKWVYALKEGSDGSKTYKARYVAKGYSQTEGINYDEVFSPTAKMTSLRMIMQMIVEYDMKVSQLDVKSAFLNAPLEHEVYVKQPEGFHIGSEGGMNVWKLRKSLYGLKQSGRNWNKTLHDFLTDLSFTQSLSDPCVYTIKHDDVLCIVLIWVDDLIIASNDDDLMSHTKNGLMSRFRMKDMGVLKYFLGIEFEFTGDTVKMKQTRYLQKVLDRFNMNDCKPRSTPCEMKLHFSDSDQPVSDQNSNYREMVGSLIYAMTTSRPDLCYVVTRLSQYLDKPSKECFSYVKHALQYVKTTLHYGLTFRKSTSGLKIHGYSDSDWASGPDRKSLSGYCYALNDHGPVISWRCKKQHSVALSSCEAEYMALSLACQEALFLKQLLNDLDVKQHDQVTLFGDNQGAISLSKNNMSTQRSKHIDIRYHFVRSTINDGHLILLHVPTDQNFADVFTKPFGKTKLGMFVPFLFGL